jgi:ATP-dependent DNA helicase RecG
MDENLLLDLFRDLESDRVERKAVFGPLKERICRTICAFCNDLPNYNLPGVIFVGVKDDGQCEGIAIDDKLLREIADTRNEGKIAPLPILTVQQVTLDGCSVVAIIVEPASVPPTYYEGDIWVRVGPTTRLATRQEEQKLADKRGVRPFDVQPLAEATISDLDLSYVEREYIPSVISRRTLDANDRTLEQRLTALRVLHPNQKPTVLGILIAGYEPRYFLPGAYVQFLRIDGIELTDPILDQSEVDGQLGDVISFIDSKLASHISIATEISGQSIEIQHPDYPMEALRQIVRNAIMHRDYHSTNNPIRITWFKDRIEILNPGGPFGLVNETNFGQPGVTDYRNPHIAEAMKNMGYVQRFGLGIQLIRRELQKNGNPPPDFEPRINDNWVLVTVRKRT